MKKLLSIIFLAVVTVVSFAVATPAHAAGAFSPDDQRILDALHQPITISGKTFYLPASYIAQAENVLKQNNYSTAQADAVIAKINNAAATLEAQGIDVSKVNSLEDLRKVLPTSVIEAIKADVQSAASVLGLTVAISGDTVTIVNSSNSSSTAFSTGSVVKQTGANYLISAVALVAMMVIVTGALIINKRADIA